MPDGTVPELPASGEYTLDLYIGVVSIDPDECVIFCTGRWQRSDAACWGAVAMIAKAHEPDPRERERGKLWALLLEWHENDVLLHHPDYDSGGESHITHMPPFIGISTTAYEDVDQILQRVYQE